MPVEDRIDSGPVTGMAGGALNVLVGATMVRDVFAGCACCFSREDPSIKAVRAAPADALAATMRRVDLDMTN